jgi:hypothetical protein
MKLQKTFLLIAAIALMAFVGVGQANAQGARQRPFSDWLNAQESSCNQFVIWWIPQDFSTMAFADYTGKFGACMQNAGGPALNTVVNGTVSERDLPDGTAEILVNVHFTNTLAYARDLTQGDAPLILGYYPSELIGHPENRPGLASGYLQAKFIIEHPGDPLPDLVFTNVLSIAARINANGPLRAEFGVPEGTPGKFVVSQTGLTIPGGGVGVADSFPAELVRVFKAGN